MTFINGNCKLNLLTFLSVVLNSDYCLIYDTIGTIGDSHNNFVTIIDIPEGEHHYKFFIDGNWRHDENQVSTDNINT